VETNNREADALKRAAEQLEGEPAAAGEFVGPEPGAQPSPAGVDYMAEARDLVQFWRMLISSVGPSLSDIYDDATCDRLAAALGPVMAKYNFDLSRFGPELVLAAVAIPLTIRTYRAIGMENKRRAAEAKAKAAAGDGPRPTEPHAPGPIVDHTDPSSLHTRA
jgi:hypothetical protein